MSNTYRNISTLYNWSQNPRAIKKDKFEELKKRITKRGQIKPLIITPDGEVLGGNMRLRAMQELGIKEAWVSVVTPTSEADKIEIALTDNEEMGYYEDQALAELIAQYKDEIDLSKYSVHLKEPQTLEEILKQFSPDEVIEDEVPEVADEAVSELGKVYQLGRHRVMCGDSTKIEDVEKLMDGKKADMVFTDPPYGMDLDTDYTAMNGTLRDGSHVDRNKHDRVIGDGDDFNPLFITNIFNLFDYCKEMFLWGADYYAELIPERNRGSWVIWDKTGDEVKDKGFGSSFETCWSRQKHKRTFARIWWQGIFGVKDDQKGRIHPTQKPVQLADWFLKRWGEGLNIVVDLFLGSGSTLIACEQTNRTCYGMELDPKYVDVIRKRYAKFIDPDNWESKWVDITPETDI